MSIIKSMISANVLAFALFAGGAQAATTVYSSSYGVKANLSVVKGAVTALAEVAPVGGTAAPAYDRSVTVASVDQSARLVDGLFLDAFQSLRTGIVTGTASSTYPATPAASACR